MQRNPPIPAAVVARVVHRWIDELPDEIVEALTAGLPDPNSDADRIAWDWLADHDYDMRPATQYDVRSVDAIGGDEPATWEYNATYAVGRIWIAYADSSSRDSEYDSGRWGAEVLNRMQEEGFIKPGVTLALSFLTYPEGQKAVHTDSRELANV